MSLLYLLGNGFLLDRKHDTVLALHSHYGAATTDRLGTEDESGGVSASSSSFHFTILQIDKYIPPWNTPLATSGHQG